MGPGLPVMLEASHRQLSLGCLPETPSWSPSGHRFADHPGCQSFTRQAMNCSIISPVQAASDDEPEMVQDAPAAALVHLSVEASCRLTDTSSTEKITT